MISYEHSDNRHSENGKFYLLMLLIAAVTALSYLNLLHNGFVRYDDYLYVVENSEIKRGISFESIKWAFSLDSHKSFWHPLTWLSLMLDYQLFGENPVWYHVENLLLHIGNVLLVFTIFSTASGRVYRSFFVALLFALHPVNVETVAWVAERKSLLSSFFGFSSLLAYISYAKRGVISSYLLSLLLFSLSLLAKPMLITLPLLLLMIDHWPLGRISAVGVRKILVEKVPFFVLTLLSSLLTMLSITSLVNSSEPLSEKTANAIVTYVSYIGKFLWPAKLPVYYPTPPGFLFWQIAGALLILLLISAFSFIKRDRYPWLFFGWFWYLGVFVPMIGIVRNGLWASMSNRHAYIPFIGLLLVTVWGVAGLTEKFRERTKWPAFAGGVVALLLAVLTFNQVKVWKDTFTLFEYTIRVTKDNSLAYGILADAYYLLRGDTAKASELLMQEYRINPGSLQADVDNAKYNYQQNNLYSALHSLKKALIKKKDHIPALYYSGKVHEALGKNDRAMESYYAALVSNEPDKSVCKPLARLELIKLLERETGADVRAGRDASSSEGTALKLRLLKELKKGS